MKEPRTQYDEEGYVIGFISSTGEAIYVRYAYKRHKKKLDRWLKRVARWKNEKK
jgi:hypothetical protein